MFSRYFFVLFAVIMVVTLASVNADSSDEVEHEVSLDLARRNLIVDKVEEILKNFFKNVTEICLKEAIEKCKKYWYNPVKVIQCGKEFFSVQNIGCFAGISHETFYCVKV